MKTLRFIGTTLLMVVLCLNFTACSDDDDDIDISQLEGTWGLVRSVQVGKAATKKPKEKNGIILATLTIPIVVMVSAKN